MPRIGVFGGSFNPVHLAHLILAECACQKYELDTVVFVPAKVPPHKPEEPLAPAQDRLEMLRLAIESNPHFEVSTVELDRDGPSYTLLTVRELSRTLAPGDTLYLIVGSDSLDDMPTWWRAEELAREVHIVCLQRPGFLLGSVDKVRERFGAGVATAIREGFVDAPLLQISSSAIRSRVASGRSIRYLIPEPVREYIAAHGLYRQG